MGKKLARKLRIPSYRKHHSGQARVTISGRDYYLGPYDSEQSKTAYQRLISEYLATNGVMQPTASHDELTIVEMLDQFVSYANLYYGLESTELSDLKRIMRRLNRSYADLPASKFAFVQFEAIRNEMLNEGSSRTYINEQMRRCVRIFRWAASRSLISPSVAQTLGMIGGLRKGRTTAPEPRKVLPVDAEIVAATIEHLPRVVADMVRLHQCLGCRPCELCVITPAMVDRSGEVWEIRLERHKKAYLGKERTLYVGPRGQAILTRYLLRPESQHCFRPVENESREDETGKRKRLPKANEFGRRAGDFYDSNTYARAIRQACDSAFPAPAGTKGKALEQWRKEYRWSPNRLRHSFGTEIRRHERPEAARVLLGHSDLKTTEIYAERDRDQAIRTAKRLG